MTSCIICHLEITNGVGSSQSCPNGHFIHSDCLKDWLRDFSNCPLCGVPYSPRVILQSDKLILFRLKSSKVRWIKCPDCRRKLRKEEFFTHSCEIIPYEPEVQPPESPVSLKRDIMVELRHFFSRRTQSGQIFAQSSKKRKKEKRPRLTDEEIMILDLESDEGIKLIKQYEEEVGYSALQKNKETQSFVRWLKGAKVKTRDRKKIEKEITNFEKIAQTPVEENKEVKPRLSDKDFKILDLESEEGIKVMKQYEEEIGEIAMDTTGRETESFVGWLKGEEVETLDARLLREREADLKRNQEHLKLKQEIFKNFLKFFEPSIYAKKNVENALEFLAMALLFEDEKMNKEMERILEKIKKLEDYDEDKYPYSVILKLFSGDYDYRWSFPMGRRRRRGGGDNRFPYPYIFKPPEPPDDFSGAPQTKLRVPLKEKDPEEEIYCQYCGKELTKEEQITHSCKRKPE